MQDARLNLKLKTREARIVFSLVTLVLFLGIQAFAASPALHHLLHPDADRADHHCAVTMLAAGQMVLGSLEIRVEAPTISSMELTIPASPVLAPIAYRLLPERAPPALLA